MTASKVANAPGRPRDPKVRELILETAQKLLAAEGYDGLSFEAISQLTGISRPTIYRRWKSKARLVHEIAYGVKREKVPDIIAEEGLLAQIRLLTEQAYDHYFKPENRSAEIGLLSAWHFDPSVRELSLSAERLSRREVRKIVQKGKALKLIKDDVNSDTLFDLLIGSIVFRSMYSHFPARSSVVDEIAELITAGLRP